MTGMNAADVTLPEEDDWDHVLSLDLLVSRADYGVLDMSKPLGKFVLLVEMDHPKSSEETVRYTALQWTPQDGVHYDGDGMMTADHLAALVSGEDAVVTRDWSECERFLTPNNRREN